MTYGNTRSVNADLHEGITDGTFKKVIRDRGGFPENLTHAVRQDLDDTWYGIHELPHKYGGDGIPAPTPNFVATPPARLV